MELMTRFPTVQKNWREKKREKKRIRVSQTLKKKRIGSGKTKKKIGSGKPYVEGSEVEATLTIPALSNGRHRDEWEEEERIRTDARKRVGSKCE